MDNKRNEKVNNDNFIVRLFKNIFNSSDDEINKLNNQVDDVIRDTIPSMNNSGEDRAFTDLFKKYLSKGLNPQYAFENRNGKIDGNAINMLFRDYESNLADISQRKELYNTYRYLTKNIPQLDAAIDIIVENIISPDEIFKEVLRIVPSNKNFLNDNELDGSTTRVEAMDINNILNNLRIEEKLFAWLSNCLLTGNTYIEIIDTKEVTSTYLSENSELYSTNNAYIKSLKDNEIKNRIISYNNLDITNENKLFFESENKELFIAEKQFIDSLLDENIFTIDNNDFINKSLIESYKNTINYEISSISDKDYRDLVFNRKFDDSKGNASEEKNDKSNQNTRELEGNENYKTNLYDIILKQHDSENVIKITNSGFLLGYLVVKEKEMNKTVQNKIFGTIGNVLDITSEKNKNSSEKITNLIIDKILDGYKNEFNSKGISRSDIDTPDIRKLIATIIMEKKTANIRFVPPSNMIEFINYSKYGDNEYGVSVLDSCLFMAKYYVALITSYTIFNITRAPEKRLFKVEVKTDTNVKNAIEEVISRVKQKEIAFRDFHKKDAMPNELTAFDDIFMPSIDGQSPISIEGIPGQSSNIDTSYLDDIRRMIINATKVPPSLLGDTENSYHTSATQENYKFARTILRYQQQFQTQLTSAISKIYYLISGGKNIKLNRISFNPPAFTKVEQIATMVGQADVICNFVVDSYGTDPATGTPLLKKKIIAREYAKFIDWDRVDELYKKSTIDSIKNNEFAKIENKDKNIDDESSNLQTIDDQQ